MVKKKSFEDSMRDNPQKIPFKKLCKFLDKIAEKKQPTGGSHIKYKLYGQLVNVQQDKKDKKYSKKYQVQQVLNILDQKESKK